MSLINENHALIQAEGLQKFYTRGNEKVVALRGVDLRVPAGEFIVIVGSSGSGKPTLLHLLVVSTGDTSLNIPSYWTPALARSQRSCMKKFRSI